MKLMSLIIVAFSATALGAPATQPDLGNCASFHGARLLPANSLWNKDISKDPVDSNSDVLIASIGLNKPLHPDFGQPYGIPYVIVSEKQAKVPVKFVDYPDESDPGPYPIPPDAPIEGGQQAKDGDRHVLVYDRDNQMLYEMWQAVNDKGNWHSSNGAVFDLKPGGKGRPKGWTSADAAGLPILPGLVRYDEVMEQKEITHAIRFTIQKSRRAYVPPATHQAGRSSSPRPPPMGMRVRLKADVDISSYPAGDQVILKALKKYGMILADNGSDWFMSGAPDPRWNDDELNLLKKIRGKDFEVVKMEGLVTN